MEHSANSSCLLVFDWLLDKHLQYNWKQSIPLVSGSILAAFLSFPCLRSGNGPPIRKVVTS